MGKIFSFDLGSGSIGECVRDGAEVKHLNSLLIDSEFASISTIREQRRAFRTRLAHKARESWWIEVAQKAGLPIPGTDIRKDKFGNYIFTADEKMLREFPTPNDETIYNSALLRIALIQGKPLEGWQIFKAVWSAFQHRGYKTNTWKNADQMLLTERSEEENKKEQEEKKSTELYKQKLSVLPQEYQLPCYYEAYKMGLWDFKTNEFINRLKAAPSNARNKVGKEQIIAPRDIVEKELRLLLERAKNIFPALPDIDFILYGPNREPNAGIKEHKARKFEHQGLLGQKTPRFDNRIIAKCSLIPRFNVCKSKEPLSKEVRFLFALKNFRFLKNGDISSFDFEEINELLNKSAEGLSETKENFIGKRDIKNYLKSKGYEALSEESISAPKTGGRSRFCRPALKILKELILSGKNPHDFYMEAAEKVLNTDAKKGLVKEDYKFLLAMPNDWYRIHIPDFREEDKKLSKEERLAKIDDLLSSISNVIVRHRLIMLMRRIEYLDKKYGMPDYCVLEIGREEFISEKEKVKYQKEIDANYKKNIAACEKLRKEKIPITYKNIEMIKLFEEQKSINIYDVKSDTRNLKYTLWSSYDIDHIVPTSRGGTNSFSNKVITTNDLNQSEKGDKTPYEWLSCDNSKWNDFLENLKRTDIDVKSKKYLYLISPDAVKEAQIQKDLRATQYMEKIAKKLISLYFGWGEHTLGDKRRMFVCTGGFTAEVRRTYNLNFILYEDLKNLSEEQIVYMTVTGELEKIKKNRGDKRHHALDALVISFAKEIIRDKKSGTLILPEYARNRKYFENVISKVFPIQLRSKKPALRETIYALRARQEGKELKYYMVSRFNTRIKDLFEKISDAKSNTKKIFDLSIRKSFEDKLKSNPTQEEWKMFLKDFKVSGNPIYKISMINSKGFSTKEVFDDKGSFKTSIGEYRAMGKVKGQYLMPKEGNKGQIIYNDGKKWIVEQIYPFDSVAKKLQKAKEKYGKVLFWNTGISLYLPNQLTGSLITKIVDEETNKKTQKSTSSDIKIGKYKLNTITGSSVFITSLASGKKYSISLKTLLEEGKVYKERS